MKIKKGLRFTLSDDLLEVGKDYFLADEEYNFEYYVSEVNEEDGVATVSWLEDGKEQSVKYTIKEIKQNISEGDYIVL